MRMLRRTSGKRPRDRIRNECIQKKLEENSTKEKLKGVPYSINAYQPWITRNKGIIEEEIIQRIKGEQL